MVNPSPATPAALDGLRGFGAGWNGGHAILRQIAGGLGRRRLMVTEVAEVKSFRGPLAGNLEVLAWPVQSPTLTLLKD